MTSKQPEITEDATERLELKIAFLEKGIAELSDVVYAQQRQIERLETKLLELASQLERGSVGESPYTLEEEKPPHF